MKFVTKNGCFTLVELLVVIAVIAILAGMLLPALNKARQKVQETVCMSNQKAVSRALFMYADDWKDKYPVATQQIGAGAPTGWSEILYSGDYIDAPTVGKSSVFVCPTYGKRKWTASYETYGMWNGDSSRGELVWTSGTTGYYALDRKKMSDRLIFCDSTSSAKAETDNWSNSCQLANGDGAELTTSLATAKSCAHLRHNGACTAAFNDGSVRTLRKDWFQQAAFCDFMVLK